MALEALLERMIASLDANTAAHGGTVPTGTTTATTAATTGKGGKGKDKDAPAKAPAISFEEVKAKAVIVMDKKSKPLAKKIIKDVGKADALTDVKPDNYSALMAAFEEALAEADEPAADDDGDL